MKKGNLILLNGSSSCGKTSTCRALQDMFEDQYILLGLDVYSQATPPKQNNMKTIEPGYFTAEKYMKDGLPYFHITTGPLLDQVICTSYLSIAVFLDKGINIISDQLFWSPAWFKAALDAFIPFKVFFVGMFVSDEEGARRENKRGAGDEQNVIEGGRLGGWNRTSAIVTHKNMVYDFEIDNTSLSIEETASGIKTAYENTPEPQAFKKLFSVTNR
jgi:chloramphenicol 3-O phosphotransferase